MPFNGTGDFTVAGTPFLAGTTIQSTPTNAKLTDLAGGLSNAVTRDGQSPPLQDLPMGGFKHTNVGDGVALTDYASMKNLRDMPPRINLITNGNPLISQRGYVSGAAVPADNTYTLDMLRVVVSGQALSWSDADGIRTVTAPSGGVEQVIEGASILPSTYTLSWDGSATATVNGVAVANGGQAILPGGVNATVRLSSGTFAKLQLEPGPFATPFEMRSIGVELALCQRYYEVVSVDGRFWPPAAAILSLPVYFATPKRTVPTLTPTGVITSANIAAEQVSSRGPLGFCYGFLTLAAGDAYVIGRLYAASCEPS